MDQETQQPVQPGPRRRLRIARAGARREAVARDRIALFRAQGYPPREVARLAGVPLEEITQAAPEALP